MIRKFIEWVFSPMGRIAMLITALSLFSLAAYGIYQTQLPPEQPIQFTHKLHVGLGIQCLYCHPGALRGPSPGIPTINKCWGCHQQIAKTQTSPLLAPMVKAMNEGVGFEWVPVAIVPDFVHFNHRPHVAAYVDWDGEWWRYMDRLLLGIFGFMSFTIIARANLKTDLLIVFVGICGGLAIESWGTQTNLWHYYTAERPPLWIIPAWPIASLSIDRITRFLHWMIEQANKRIKPTNFYSPFSIL